MTAKPHINPRKSIGNYWLGKTLGHGSSGCVKLGFHKTTMEKVAIKIISKAYLQTSEILANATKREMAILKLVRHPNVVRYIEAVDDPNVPYVYIIMEYVEGCELFDYLLKCRRINEPEARNIFWQVCVAVDWCHQRNICHRDLKPENILLTTSKQKVKLVDFGMASMQPPTSLLQTSCGSPHYACPEIVTGKSYDGRLADVWSCGVILFALLSGRLPFEDNSVRNLLHRIKSGQYVMSTYFSDDARDLISRMLTTDPKKRIRMKEVLRHRFFTQEDSFHYPQNTFDEVYQTGQEIDQETISVMKVLLRSQTEGTIRAALMSETTNVEQNIFMLLKKSKEQVIGEPMILTTAHHCAPLEFTDLKSPTSALSSSSTLCDTIGALKKTPDSPDRAQVKTSSVVLEDGLAVTSHSHDTSRAKPPDGAILVLPDGQEREKRNCPMILQVGSVTGCRKSRPADAHTSFATTRPLMAMDTVYDIRKWQNGRRAKPIESKRHWMNLSFWKLPEDTSKKCFVECTGDDEQQAISKIIYTINNLMQGTFIFNNGSKYTEKNIGRGEIQTSCKHIPVFVMFYLEVSRVQPLAAGNKTTVVFALSPINTDLPTLATASQDLQTFIQQNEVDEEEALLANGWCQYRSKGVGC